jgi:hypothetical protein
VVASPTFLTARSNASSVWPEGDVIPLTLRIYWRAAASISTGVAFGSRPRKTVILRHMLLTIRTAPPRFAPGTVQDVHLFKTRPGGDARGGSGRVV